MPLRQRRVTTNRIVLIGEPYREDDVECSCGVVEEFRHYCFHAWMREEEGKSISFEVFFRGVRGRVDKLCQGFANFVGGFEC